MVSADRKCRRLRTVEAKTQSSARYCGARPWMHLKTVITGDGNCPRRENVGDTSEGEMSRLSGAEHLRFLRQALVSVSSSVNSRSGCTHDTSVSTPENKLMLL